MCNHEDHAVATMLINVYMIAVLTACSYFMNHDITTLNETDKMDLKNGHFIIIKM